MTAETAEPKGVVGALRALLERAELPACEASLCETQPAPWPAWYVVPVAENHRQNSDRVAEVMWAGPGLWSDPATRERTAARARLFAEVPGVLPGLLKAAESLELVRDLHADYVRAAEERAAEGRAAYRAMMERAEALARERDDLAAILETRNAELGLAQEKVRELEAEREAARGDLGAAMTETLREAAQRSKRELDLTVNQIAPLFRAVRDEQGNVETARFFDAATVATRRAGELLQGAAAACEAVAAAARERWLNTGQDGPAKYERSRLLGEQAAASTCAAAVRALIPAGAARGG